MESESHLEPLPISAAEPESESEGNKLPIRTYHCRFCSHLLIASTRELLSSSAPLRRRRRIPEGAGAEAGSGGLDGALILEVPPSSSSSSSRNSKKRKPDDGNEERKDPIPETAAPTVPQAAAAAPGEGDAGGRKTEQAHYTIPLSTLIPDTTPVVIRREDGFEKRVLLRCGRCRVVVGYKLCNGTDLTADRDFDEDLEEDDGIGLRQEGKEERAIYLLPGSIVGTEDLDVGVTGSEGGRGGDVLNAMVDRNPVLKGMEGEWMEWLK